MKKMHFPSVKFQKTQNPKNCTVTLALHNDASLTIYRLCLSSSTTRKNSVPINKFAHKRFKGLSVFGSNHFKISSNVCSNHRPCLVGSLSGYTHGLVEAFKRKEAIGGPVQWPITRGTHINSIWIFNAT